MNRQKLVQDGKHQLRSLTPAQLLSNWFRVHIVLILEYVNLTQDFIYLKSTFKEKHKVSIYKYLLKVNVKMVTVNVPTHCTSLITIDHVIVILTPYHHKYGDVDTKWVIDKVLNFHFLAVFSHVDKRAGLEVFALGTNG